MVVIVRWLEHNRQYEIGIKRFLRHMGIDVTDEQINKILKHLLEQEEMTRVQPEHQ